MTAARWKNVSCIPLLLLCFAIFAPGCASREADVEAPPSIEPPVVVDQPGIYEAPRGRVRVVGIFDRIDYEGGSWAVVGVAPTQAAESHVVAVLVDPEQLRIDLPALRGRYVEIIGMLREDAPAGTPGPEVEPQSIIVIVEDDPADPIP